MRGTLVPFGRRSLRGFRRDMDELFNQFFTEAQPREELWTPRLNVSETDADYEVSLDVPGMTPDAFDVEMRQGHLWITGERKSEHEEEGKTWHRIERSYGRFQRSVHLGDDVNPEQVKAEYKDGVLRITVPKSEKSQTRKVAVKG
jgi:HSP20 family protein